MELKKNEYIAYTFGDNNLSPYPTKAAARSARNAAFAESYDSVAEMERLLPIKKYIFIRGGEFGADVAVRELD